MTMTNCLKLPLKKYSFTPQMAHIVLGYGDAQLFKTPSISNCTVTAPSDQILLADEDSQSFETPRKKS